MNSDLISRSALLKQIDEERKYLRERGLFGAEHILVHNFREFVENAPSVEVWDSPSLTQQIVVPEGTFEKIYNDNDDEEDI